MTHTSTIVITSSHLSTARLRTGDVLHDHLVALVTNPATATAPDAAVTTRQQSFARCWTFKVLPSDILGTKYDGSMPAARDLLRDLHIAEDFGHVQC